MGVFIGASTKIVDRDDRRGDAGRGAGLFGGGARHASRRSAGQRQSPLQISIAPSSSSASTKKPAPRPASTNSCAIDRAAAMDWRYLLDSFDGRIGRKTFWIAMAVVGVANFAGVLRRPTDRRRQAERHRRSRSSPIRNSPSPPSAAMTATCRYGSSAFSSPQACCSTCSRSPAGPAPTSAEHAFGRVAVPFTILGLGLLIELGFRKGTPGPNQYGPDPLAHC